MYEKIKPRLGSIEFFEYGSFRHAGKPTYEEGEWFIQGQFTVVDLYTQQYNDTKAFYKRRRGNKGGNLGHVFLFVICSQGYAERFHEEFERDNIKPVIMQNFDANMATDLIESKIRNAGDDISIDQLWAHLSKFADTKYDEYPEDGTEAKSESD